MKQWNYTITTLLSILVIISIVWFVNGGLTGRLVEPNPCAEIGLQGYNVPPEYLSEFEGSGYKCYESPAATESYCCLKN